MMSNLKKDLRNLLFVVNLAIVAGFVYGLVKSIINIYSNRYLHYEMYNLIYFDLAYFISKYALLFILAAAVIFILATVCKLMVDQIKLSNLGTGKRLATLISSVVIIIIATIIAYLYHTEIIAFLKSNPSTKWLGNFSNSQKETNAIFIQGSIFFAAAILALILYIVWPAIFKYIKQLVYNVLNPRKVIYFGLGLFALTILLNLSIFLYKRVNTPTGPNVIIITIDTLRADHLGSYGYKRNTSPNIDSFGEKAVLFENAISQASWTFPSMASMFTALYPSEARVKNITSTISNEHLTLSEYMKNNFYNTIAVISQIVVSKVYGFSQGFNTFNQKHMASVNELSSEIITNQAVEYLSKNIDSKFFLWVHYFDPHHHYKNHAEYDYGDNYTGKLPKNLDTRQLNKIESSLNKDDVEYIKDIYDEEISYTDKHIGVLIDSIFNLGLGNNTIIVLTADHGEEFMERTRFGHGSTLYQELIHVPLIVYNPFDTEGMGKRVSNYVEIRNIPKTILSISGFEEDLFFGFNLLDNEEIHIDRNVIAEDYGFTEGKTRKAVINNNWKLINNRDNQISELYKLDSDSGEKNNLITKDEKEINIQREKLHAVLSLIRKKETKETGKANLSKEDIKQLKALGYIQ